MNPRDFCRLKGYSTAIFLTYNFDPHFFERVVLRDLEIGENEDILVIADSNEIARSVSRWREEVVHLGRKYQLAPATGPTLFHPKMILRVGPESSAVWLGSGNLTFGGWGGNQELATSWYSTNDPGVPTMALSLLQRIQGLIPDSQIKDTIGRAISDLTHSTVATQDELAEADVLLTSESRSLSTMLRERWSEKRFRKVSILTGSTDEGGALVRWLHEEFGIDEALIVVDQNHSRFSPKVDRLSCDLSIRSFSEANRPLHAKFYWFEGDDGCSAIMGSANCSAAAWLIAPQNGGNTEAIVVYDKADPQVFDHILRRFRNDALTETALAEDRTLNDLDREVCLAQPELSFDSSTGVLSLAFSWSKSTPIAVQCSVDGDPIVFQGSDLSWISHQYAPFAASRTRFLELVITFESGEESCIVAWVDDLAVLRQSSKARKITEGLISIAIPGPLSEHRKILADLEVISRTLLGERQYFEDGVRRERKGGAPESPESENAIDPDDFIKSIEEIGKTKTDTISLRDFGEQIGIEAVLRAFFGRFVIEDESEDDAQFDEDSGIAREKRIVRHEQARAAKPEARARDKFRRIISGFLDGITNDRFLENCTIRQFQNGVAVPFVMCDHGLEGGWIDSDEATIFIRRTFDILFVLKQTGRSERGLLARLRAQYVERGLGDEFSKAVGDGTLWLLFLVTIGRSAWSGPNGAFQRKLAMRHIFRSRDLIESAQPGRIGQLVGMLEQSKVLTLINDSRGAKSELDELEAYLSVRWDALMQLQKGHRIPFEENDLMWIQSGWAEVKDAVECGDKTTAYLHTRAEAKTVSTALFLNATGLARLDPDLATLMSRSRAVGTTTRSEDRDPPPFVV